MLSASKHPNNNCSRAFLLFFGCKLVAEELTNMDIRFDGKRALVTGAGKGIGRAVTLKLVECGAEVVAVSRTQSDLDELKKISLKIQTICVDVGCWNETKLALKNVEPIDLLVNNAAILKIEKYGAISEEDVDKLVNINVKSIINITQCVLNQMKARRKGGAVVNVSSMMGINVTPGCGIYCATKGAMDQLTRSMALEFGLHNIRVNSINPTVVRTKMSENMFDPNNEIAKQMIRRTPLKKFAEVDDVVNPILFLLSDKAAMISGITMPVDGGLSVVYA